MECTIYMVKTHNLDVCRGVAGRLISVKGVMIHNTADVVAALEHAKRLKSYSAAQLGRGFAHYYIDHEDDVRTEQTFNATYHSANGEGNYNYISLETVGSATGDRAKFLQAEQNTFYRAAIELRYYGLPVNRNTVRLHCELDVGTYTECPKRSMIEHAGFNSTSRQPQWAIDKVKDYFIKEIKKYYDNPKLKPDGGEKAVAKKATYHQKAGKYKMKKQCSIYTEKELKNKSAWLLPVGTNWYIEDIIVHKGMTRGRIRLNNDIRYVTLNTDYWTLVSEGKPKLIK